MRSLIVIVAGLVLCLRYTDLQAGGLAERLLAPLGVVVFLIALGLWLVTRGGLTARVSGRRRFFGGWGA